MPGPGARSSACSGTAAGPSAVLPASSPSPLRGLPPAAPHHRGSRTACGRSAGAGAGAGAAAGSGTLPGARLGHSISVRR